MLDTAIPSANAGTTFSSWFRLPLRFFIYHSLCTTYPDTHRENPVTMIQRRKAATYGKAIRKPTTDFSSFAQASEPTTKHVYQRPKVSNMSTTDGAAVKVAQRSTLLTPPREAGNTFRSKSQTPTGSPYNEAQSNMALYDVPTSGEDEEHSTSSPNTGARKRRKLTPMNDR